MVAMVTVVGVDCVVGLLVARWEQVVQGQVGIVDEGRKRHAVDAVSGYVCVLGVGARWH
jgi:hypothetical protein